MAGGGYIKLYRSVRGTAIADNPEYFAAWIHLLLMATHTEHDQVVGRQVVKLLPGQLVFGRDKFSSTTGLSVNKVRSALKVMETLKMITIKSTTKYSVISITKWLEYQPQPPTDDQQTANKSPTDDHKQEGINKGSKKDQDKDLSPPAKPDDPIDPNEIANLYNEILGDLLPSCKAMSKTRKANLRARVKEDAKRRDMDWWRRYFEYIADSHFLTGQTTGQNGKAFSADMEWILKPENMLKIIEGKYHREG